MTKALHPANNHFFNLLDRQKTTAIVQNSLKGAEDGELFLEYRQNEAFAFDDGILKNSSFDVVQGFGLRRVIGDVAAYAHSNELSEQSLLRAASTVRSIPITASINLSENPYRTNQLLYSDHNPLMGMDTAAKISLLKQIDTYTRQKEASVKQVMCSLLGSWQVIQMIRADGSFYTDVRPLVRLNVSVMVTKGDRQEMGSCGTGGRVGYQLFTEQDSWKKSVDEAVRQALINLESQPAPAGEMTVVLGSGWPGVLLHEAIGHGLEGDFNRKKTSAFSELLGKQVAASGVTVVDDGTLSERRGSLTMDDEGTPTQRTVLIENGILVNYLQDRQNARLMNTRSTGNGRRQSYAHLPMPRMTNTLMENGRYSSDEIIKSVKKGLYAVNFSGGQVDITSGKFVFSTSEAYMIENGRIGPSVKGATLIGNGPDILTKVKMIGNDLKLDAGVGTCGKDGQSVPVGVGQPTIKIEGLTVGGTHL